MSNAHIVKAAKLVDSISFEQEDKKYNLAEVLVDSDNFNASVSLDEEGLPTQLLAKTRVVAIHQKIENADAINKLCTFYVGSKLT